MEDSLSWEKHDNAVVFRFHGSIESDLTDILRRKILDVIEKENTATAIFHLGDASYIDSMGIGMFVNLHVQQRRKVKFMFSNLTGNVLKAFGYVKLISFFDIRDTLNDALKELSFVDR